MAKLYRIVTTRPDGGEEVDYRWTALTPLRRELIAKQRADGLVVRLWTFWGGRGTSDQGRLLVRALQAGVLTIDWPRLVECSSVDRWNNFFGGIRQVSLYPPGRPQKRRHQVTVIIDREGGTPM